MSDHENKSFWSVWRASSGSASNKRHDSFQSALDEAERLARIENAKFFVLRTIGIVAPVESPVEYSEIEH